MTSSKFTRRTFFALGGASTAGLAAAACSPNDEASSADGTASSVSDFEELVIPFSGEHQAGIITPMQNNMHFAAFDVDEEIDRDDLIDLLTRWTKASRRLTMGGDVTAKGAFGGGENFPPDDSGEAVDLGPSGLTITFGFGKNLFRKQFGLEGKLPKEFTDMPKMTNDFTDQDHSHGDICIMACANDPQVAGHAIRNLTRLGVPDAVLRWTQIGFGRASVTSREEKTPRNLFGQKDGTANIRSDETDTLNEHVWIPENSSQSWAAGGSYMTVRRIRMLTEIWDTLQLQEQERVTGRDKHEGAPLSGGDEFTEPDFDAKDERGLPKIDHESHLFNVHPNQNGGIKMLRRAFNFIDGSDEQGRLLAGLFFIGFTKTVDRFATVHQSMSRDMMFVEYCKTTNTGTYLVPPGIGDGDDDFIGQQMFA